MKVSLKVVPGGPIDQLVKELTYPFEDLVTVGVGKERAALCLHPTYRCRERAFSGSPGFPAVFMFPPPWHPFDLLLANRGVFGRMPDREGLQDCADTSAHWRAYCNRVAGVMFWDRRTARVLYHLCSPLHTNAHPVEYEARAVRRVLYARLGIPPRMADVAARAAETHYLSGNSDRFALWFWSEEMYGEVVL
jgi:hypothetical protein